MSAHHKAIIAFHSAKQLSYLHERASEAGCHDGNISGFPMAHDGFTVNQKMFRLMDLKNLVIYNFMSY